MPKPDKKRSKFGEWLHEQQDLNLLELEKAAGVSKSTIESLCRNATYRPKISTVVKINQGLKKLGKNIDINDFFA